MDNFKQSCTASTDDVVITFNQAPTTSHAGADQTGAATCGLTTVTLAANAPSIGTGAWSIISGAGGTFDNASKCYINFHWNSRNYLYFKMDYFKQPLYCINR